MIPLSLVDICLGIKPCGLVLAPCGGGSLAVSHHPVLPAHAELLQLQVRGCCGQALRVGGKPGCAAQPSLENLALPPAEARAEFVRVSTPQRQGGGGGKSR